MADFKEDNRMTLDEETKHWWLWTRLQYIEKCLKSIDGELSVVEFGCGTGQNIYYLRQKCAQASRIRRIKGVDPALPENFDSSWVSQKDVITSEYPDRTERYELLLATDVVEHIENDLEILKEWQNYLKPGAVVLITVPAFQCLWSYQDVYLEHYRRYTKKHLRQVAENAGLETVKVTYAFSWALPIVFLVRKIIKRNSTEASNDLSPTNPLLNSIFKALCKIELIMGGCPFFGTSVIGVFKVREKI